MSRWAKFFLTATAFAPVLLVYSGVSLIHGAYCMAAGYFVVFMALLLVCLTIMSFFTQSLPPRNYVTKSVETADQEVLSFLLIYLLPLISKDLTNYNLAIWFIIALFYCFVVTTGYGFHFNPLLTFFGYRFYKVTEENGLPYVLIARRRIYRLGETLTVVALTDFILVEKSHTTSV